MNFQLNPARTSPILFRYVQFYQIPTQMNKIAKFEFISNWNIERVRKYLIQNFNLNPERKSDFEDFFKYENSKYQGFLKSDNTFTITANKLNFSNNNGIDFFFTTVKGMICEKSDKTIIKIQAEISKPIMIIFLLLIPIYLIIMYFSFSSGLFGIIIFSAIYFFGRIKVKEDFETLKNEIKNCT